MTDEASADAADEPGSELAPRPLPLVPALVAVGVAVACARLLTRELWWVVATVAGLAAALGLRYLARRSRGRVLLSADALTALLESAPEVHEGPALRDGGCGLTLLALAAGGCLLMLGPLAIVALPLLGLLAYRGLSGSLGRARLAVWPDRIVLAHGRWVQALALDDIADVTGARRALRLWLRDGRRVDVPLAIGQTTRAGQAQPPPAGSEGWSARLLGAVAARRADDLRRGLQLTLRTTLLEFWRRELTDPAEPYAGALIILGGLLASVALGVAIGHGALAPASGLAALIAGLALGTRPHFELQVDADGLRAAAAAPLMPWTPRIDCRRRRHVIELVGQPLPIHQRGQHTLRIAPDALNACLLPALCELMAEPDPSAAAS